MSKKLAAVLVLGVVVPGCFTAIGGTVGGTWASQYNHEHPQRRPVSVGSSVATGIVLGLVVDGLICAVYATTVLGPALANVGAY